MTSHESRRCVLHFISHQPNTVNFPHWAFHLDKCDFFTALYHPSSVPLPLFLLLKIVFICLVCQTLWHLRDTWHFETTTGFCTDWPAGLRRQGNRIKENKKTKHLLPLDSSHRGRTFSALLTFLLVKAKCWAADYFFSGCFSFPQSPQLFLSLFFMAACFTATSLLFEALRNGIGCITIEKIYV